MPPSQSGRPIELTVDQRDLQAVARLLKDEADGKELRKELISELKAAAGPTVTDLRAAARAIPSQGLPHVGGIPLRQEIARGIVPVVRLTGARTGVTVTAKPTPRARMFRHAARQMNAASFRHRVFGRDVWVSQTGDPGWFDQTVNFHRGPFRDAVLTATQKMADRIADRIRSRT